MSSKALLINLMAAVGFSACGGARTEQGVQVPVSVPAPAQVRSQGDAEAITGCALAVDYPHRSLHDPSKVRVSARITCDL